MDKKKTGGYTKKDRDEMTALIERTQPKTGDYVGSGTVTEVPKKKKKMKRMQMGGMAQGRLANPALAAVIPNGSSEGRTRPSTVQPSPVPISGPTAVRPEPVRGGWTKPMGGNKGPVRPDPVDSRYIKTPYGIRLEGKPPPQPVRGGGGVPVQGPMGRPLYGKGSERPGMPKKRKDGMKGGGLARKGVGVALARGGLVKANGCATRGKTKGKIV